MPAWLPFTVVRPVQNVPYRAIMNFFLPNTKVPFRRLNQKALLLLLAHGLLFAIALFLAFFTRNEFELAWDWLTVYAVSVSGAVVLKSIIFYTLGHCHASWQRVSFGDLTALIWAATLSLLVLAAVNGTFLSTNRIPGMSRVRSSVLLLDWAATILLLGGIRTLYRSLREELRPLFSRQTARSAIIIGANQTGELIARNLMSTSMNRYYIVGFLDDDPELHGSRFAGLAVLGSIATAAQEVARCNVDDVLVQSGVLAGKKFRQLFDECTAAGATVKVIPAIDELIGKKSDANSVGLRAVEIKDLLRREPIQLDDAAIAVLVEGRTVMVTGAGGSIGSEICRQVLQFLPRKLLLVERGENALFLIEQELANDQSRPPFESFLADISDEHRMEQILRVHRPDIIFHAAAHKHVPLMEFNPAEAIKNNCFGTRLLAQMADRCNVREFVMISTDKAVNPTSVMGCSKLITERYVHAFAEESKTKFIVVRFGNVLASNGSVVPIFQEQIRRGGPITITDPAIERYFMTIPEAAQLVLQSAAMGSGGEIFVLDMGESVKIVDLAHDLIALSGLAEEDIEIVFTGLRPGEKLYEELYFDEERRVATVHPKVFCAMHQSHNLPEIEKLFEQLKEVIDQPPEIVRARLRDLIPEYGLEKKSQRMVPGVKRMTPKSSF